MAQPKSTGPILDKADKKLFNRIYFIMYNSREPSKESKALLILAENNVSARRATDMKAHALRSTETAEKYLSAYTRMALPVATVLFIAIFYNKYASFLLLAFIFSYVACRKMPARQRQVLEEINSLLDRYISQTDE